MSRPRPRNGRRPCNSPARKWIRAAGRNRFIAPLRGLVPTVDLSEAVQRACKRRRGNGLEQRPRFPYIHAMTITLPPGQQKWIEAQVAAGRFSSVDDAIAVAVADLMAID